MVLHALWLRALPRAAACERPHQGREAAAPLLHPLLYPLLHPVLLHPYYTAHPIKVEKLLPTLRKRTAFIYPLYAVALLLSLFVDFWRGRTLPAWWCVLLQVTY